METNPKNRIKLLLSLKNNKENDDEEENSPSDESKEYYGEEISSEECNKHLREMDAMILDIYRTKQKLRLGKIKNKLKTKEDLLNFFNIRDENDNLIPPQPDETTQDFLNKLKVNKNSKMNKEFSEIKDKLQKQEEILKSTKKENAEKKENSLLNIVSSKDDEMDAIYEQIRLMDSRCEDLLGDIDSCLKLGEDIEEIIESKYQDECINN